MTAAFATGPIAAEPVSKYTLTGKPAAATGAGAGVAAGAAAFGTVAGAGGVGLLENMFHNASRIAAPISHGSQRISPDFVAVVAAAAVLAAAPAPVATAAPARLAVSAAAPPRLESIAAGLA